MREDRRSKDSDRKVISASSPSQPVENGTTDAIAAKPLPGMLR